MKWHKINLPAEYGLSSLKVEGKKLCLIYEEAKLQVTSSKCPHAGADLSQGWCENGKLVCPIIDINSMWKLEKVIRDKEIILELIPQNSKMVVGMSEFLLRGGKCFDSDNQLFIFDLNKYKYVPFDFALL